MNSLMESYEYYDGCRHQIFSDVLKAGANPDIRNKYNFTPKERLEWKASPVDLMWPDMTGKPEIWQRFLTTFQQLSMVG